MRQRGEGGGREEDRGRGEWAGVGGLGGGVREGEK